MGLETDAKHLAAELHRDRQGLLVVLTGAGISAPSGLPTFRGPEPEAIWSREVTAIATRAFLERHPLAWWQWFLSSFDALRHAQPNPAHRALAALESWLEEEGGELLLVTQNIDTLHEAAGSRRLVKVHGSADRLRCCRPGCTHAAPRGSLPSDAEALARLAAEPSWENLPRCPACDSLLRPHALLFDELYDEHLDYGLGRVEAALARMDRLLFVGTSLSVGITDLALRRAVLRRVPVASVDPHGAAPLGVQPLPWPAERLLPSACAELGIESRLGS